MIGPAHELAPMSLQPFHYRQFVEDAKRFVAERGLAWDYPLGTDGMARRNEAWDLRKLTSGLGRNATWLRDFRIDADLQNLARQARWAEALLPRGPVLDPGAQEFVKAMVVHRCREGHNERATQDLAAGLRQLFSVTVTPPWMLSSYDVERMLQLDSGNGGRIALSTRPLIPTVNKYLLSVHAPLRLESVSTAGREFLESLQERRSAAKLPEMRALYELVRIVFCERPQNHQDLVRFAIMRVAILTGLRIEEVLQLPVDCLRWQTNTDVVTGRPAGEVGGSTKSLALHYFGEKRDKKSPDVLLEDVQWVPERFHTAIAETVEMVRAATSGLRAALKAQLAQPHLQPCSDLRRFRTTDKRELDTSDLLFLVLYRHRGGLPEVVDASAKIALAHYASLAQGLGISSRRRGTVTMFMKYSREPDADRMSISPHSLRHLLNTELFRRGVPDTTITEHFGRESVAQSYEYDHRSLAEHLKSVELPADAMQLVRPGSSQEFIAKMVVSGTAGDSHLARSFKRIQASEGDKAAFQYLVANSDGFHATPYGFCMTSFSLDPCARHLKCFDGCKHFTVSGVAAHKVSLRNLRDSLQKMRDVALSKPVKTIGRKNQIKHAEKLLAGVDLALRAQPGGALFPNGRDHSIAPGDLLA